MIMATINPTQVILQIAAQNLDGSTKDSLAAAKVRVYHISGGGEVNNLESSDLIQVTYPNGIHIWRYIWTPPGLGIGHYFGEYTLTDLDNVTAVFIEDIIITQAIPSVDDIDDELSDEHGDGSWEGTSTCGKPKIIPGNGA